MTALVQHLDLIATMSQDFAASRDIEESLRHGLALIADAVGAEASSVFLVDDDTDELVCRACTGPVDISGLRLPAHTGIVGCTIDENQPRMVRDVRQDAAFGDVVDAATGFVTRSVLCAPMTVRDQRIGAIELLNKRGGGLFEAGDRQLLQALASAAALAVFNARLAAAMVEQERVRREIELAAEIQRTMLPAPSEGGEPLWGFNRPAYMVSGDFYDVMRRADGRYAFCIGDVSGKGMNAALLMAKTASLFRCLAKTIGSPGRLLTAINDELCETGPTGVFVTMAAGLYDPADGGVVLANAGHEPALLYRAGGDFMEFPAEAPPLGIAADMLKDGVPEAAFQLAGSALYLFTDGLTEFTEAGGAMLGGAGVRTLIAACAAIPPQERIAAIIARLEAMGDGMRDDLTLLLLESVRP